MMLMMVVIVVVVDGVRWMMGGFNNAAVHSLLLLVKDAFAYVTGQLLLSVLNEMGNSLFHFHSLSLSLFVVVFFCDETAAIEGKPQTPSEEQYRIFLFTHVNLLGRGPSTNKSNFSSETKKHDK